jgi:hypothetical protein
MLSAENSPLLWVLDFVAPNFQLFGEEVTLSGDLLIASRQLWSLLHGETVRSALLGPGVIKGQVSLKGNPVDVEFLVGAVLFDPTEMRPGEPIPLIDILHPEIVDPLEQSTPEQVQEIIRTLVVKKGSVSDSKPILTLQVEGGLPITLVSEQHIVAKNISLVSGMRKAKFLLGGQKNRLYTPFKDALQSNRFSDPTKIWTFRLDQKTFVDFDSSHFRDWVIIEMQADMGTETLDTSQAVEDEFTSILTYLLGNQSHFIF